MSASMMNRSLWLVRKDVKLNYFILRGLHGPPKINEYVSKAAYPPIPNYKSDDEKNRMRTKEAVKNLQTVEEKMYQINRPKYYGWYSYIIHPDYIPSDVLDFSKFSTWTSVVEGLPGYYSDEALDKKASKIISEIGGSIEQVILDEHLYREHSHEVTNDRIRYSELFAQGPGVSNEIDAENKTSRNLIKKIHEVIHSHISLTEEHILNSGEDYDARNEGFWFRGGVQPDKSFRKKRQGVKDMLIDKERKGRLGVQLKEDGFVDQVYERALQIKHHSVVQVRHDDPLQEFVPRDDPLCTKLNVPVVDFDPRCFGFLAKCRHGTNIPGYWPEDSNQMGLLSYHTRLNQYNHKSLGRSNTTEEDERDQDLSKGILTNFGWCLSQACHLGFSPLTELTFPLASQSINTDGRRWTFFAYQLNTCDLSHNDFSEHTHQNLLWASPAVQLYSKVENGKLIDFDPDCLKPLIKMYLNKPKAREYSMTPYLEGAKVLTNFPDDYQRTRFLEIVRNQLSNRPKAVAKPEMYLWEKLLLVDNQALPQLGLARRRRWWHMSKIDFLGKEHWHPEFVNTDEKRDRYIAKGLREPWTRKGELNRRYNKFQPKIRVPLKEKIAVYEVPSTEYKGEQD